MTSLSQERETDANEVPHLLLVFGERHQIKVYNQHVNKECAKLSVH